MTHPVRTGECVLHLASVGVAGETFGQSCEKISINISNFELFSGSLITVFTILICIVLWIVIMLVLRCISLTKHIYTRKMRITTKIRQRMIKGMRSEIREEYENLPQRPDYPHLPTTYSNKTVIRIPEVPYACPQQIVTTDNNDEEINGYTVMLAPREPERRQGESRAEIPSYVELP